jgi:uncharacterized protein with LGFP repeats
LLLLVGALMTPIATPPAAAVDGSDFDPGYIISDETFFNSNAMSQAQVQAFLESKETDCLSTNPYLPCLKNYVGMSNTKAPSGPGHCGGYNSEGWESAARMIWRVGQACGINPQVILATLEKEQGLVTARAPSERQFRVAMGYGCPDSADCDAAYYGFFNQLYAAAWQFRQYTNFPERRYKIGPVAIQYHPNAGCGAPVVNIRNQATANLYNYTPYQPNAAALANLGGRGDGCSSYGNRNFWVFFNDWFGSSTATGASHISALHSAYGGAAGVLGAPTSGILTITQNGGGTAQAFQHGSIYWTASTGAHAVIVPYRDLYFAYGGSVGPIGWPNSERIAISGAPGGAGQSFTDGSIYSTDATGVHSVRGVIRKKYFAMGGALADIGWPTAEQSNVGSGSNRGLMQSFEHGDIYHSAALGTRSVEGQVHALYTDEGGPDGRLGFPASDTIPIPQNGGGYGQMFAGGSVYSSDSGTFAVSGGVRSYYFKLGGSAGSLGWPTGAQSCTGDACSQSFQRGTIYWSPGSGGRVGLPAIEELYAAMGGSSGELGERASALIPIPQNGGGYGQMFAGGSVYSSDSGTFAVSGGVRSYYFTLGGSAGSLGWPTGAQSCTGDACSQSFQRGTISWSPGSGGSVG